MRYEQKPGQGVLFKNDRKESDKHPDYKGSINIGGTDMWLSAWIKEGKKGKFMSLQAKPKEASGSKAPPKQRQEDPDDELPPF